MEEASFLGCYTTWLGTFFKGMYCLHLQWYEAVNWLIIVTLRTVQWLHYGLDVGGIVTWFPAWPRELCPSIMIQIGSGAHQPTVQWVLVGDMARVWSWPLYFLLRLRMSDYISTLICVHGLYRETFTVSFIVLVYIYMVIDMWQVNTNSSETGAILEKALLALRILRKLTVHGFKKPHESADALHFLNMVFDRAKTMLECSK